MPDDPSGEAATLPQTTAADVSGRARLVIISADATRSVVFPSGGVLSVGRSDRADVQVDDPVLSRVHFTVEAGDAGATVRDEKSSNGTMVRGKRVEGRAPLAHGEVFSAGGTKFLVLRAERSARPAAPLSTSGSKTIIEDPAMREVYRFLDQIAPGEINVLVLGETGTGKEVLVEELHRRSKRAKGPLLRLNCGALAESLLESELFGHERGAFTGAVKAKPGLLESAQGGTIFLDELGEMPLATQAKLLRVMEERKVRRVGGIDAKSIDVRFVSATNRDLEKAIESGTFRSDLYYRLNGVSVSLPPLRERVAEIPPLARAFAADAAAKNGLGATPEIGAGALALLVKYRWPGNIRELRNVVERAVLLANGAPIGVEHLPADKLRSAAATAAPAAAAPAISGDEPEEKRRILQALDACAGNQTRAAKMLGISRKVLMARLDTYGIARPKKG